MKEEEVRVGDVEVSRVRDGCNSATWTPVLSVEVLFHKAYQPSPDMESCAVMREPV
jgi:hypothetical protein